MKMNTRYAFRLDDDSEQALAEIARITEQSKSFIMRKYIQEGLMRETKELAQKQIELRNNIRILKSA